MNIHGVVLRFPFFSFLRNEHVNLLRPRKRLRAKFHTIPLNYCDKRAQIISLLLYAERRNSLTLVKINDFNRMKFSFSLLNNKNVIIFEMSTINCNVIRTKNDVR